MVVPFLSFVPHLTTNANNFITEFMSIFYQQYDYFQYTETSQLQNLQ
jgi:hypothetical protein